MTLEVGRRNLIQTSNDTNGYAGSLDLCQFIALDADINSQYYDFPIARVMNV